MLLDRAVDGRREIGDRPRRVVVRGVQPRERAQQLVDRRARAPLARGERIGGIDRTPMRRPERSQQRELRRRRARLRERRELARRGNRGLERRLRARHRLQPIDLAKIPRITEKAIEPADRPPVDLADLFSRQADHFWSILAGGCSFF